MPITDEVKKNLRLSDRQKAFVTEYVRVGSGAEAARLAGYLTKNASLQAWRLLQKDHIKEAISAEHLRLGQTEQQTKTEMIKTLGYSPDQIVGCAVDAIDCLQQVALQTPIKVESRTLTHQLKALDLLLKYLVLLAPRTGISQPKNEIKIVFQDGHSDDAIVCSSTVEGPSGESFKG